MLLTKFQASEASSFEGNFLIFFCVSMVQTQDPLKQDYFGPGGHHLNKLRKGLLGHATKFQAPEASGSEKGDF